MIFPQTDRPRVFAEAPGADFPTALARGLHARLQGQPPEAIARVEVMVNTGRLQSRLRAALMEAGPGFLPRIRLIAALDDGETDAPRAALRRRLELAQLIRGLLEADPSLGPRHAAFALADSLARLLDEMQAEGVPLSALDRLDVSQHSQHWERSLRFIRLVAQYLDPTALRDRQGAQRAAIEAMVTGWQERPPAHPVIVAGSTGSRGMTALLMRAVARLPQGALILPGFDFDMPEALWGALDDPLLSEDHPQYRFAALLRALDMSAREVALWSGGTAPDPARNRAISLALRPAPVTDRWRTEGPGLGDLMPTFARATLIEAPDPRGEALAIALILREAAAKGRSACLITPDRLLARQVTAALDRWQLRPDDSAGRPLALSAPGRFLRQTAAFLRHPPDARALVAALKNPIAHSAAERGPHLRHLRDLELWLRREGLPFPNAQDLSKWSEKAESRRAWLAWLGPAIDAAGTDALPLSDWTARHLALAEKLATGSSGSGTGELWQAEAGRRAWALMDDLTTAAPAGGMVTAADYLSLLEGLFAGQSVRESAAAHPDIQILGTLEARVQGAELVILGGLNEGIWPQPPAPDPWFNRRMRLDAGLLLPERQVGLSAHDFQQAAGATEVVFTRAKRDAEAETVPSRWLNRLQNLIAGLPAQKGPATLAAMQARGNAWLDLAARFDGDLRGVPEEARYRHPRPAPAPPVAARPRELSVTVIKDLIRDPYTIYAREILRLRPLDALAALPDARLRGIVLHKLLDRFTRAHQPGRPVEPAALLSLADAMLAEHVPWPAARALWRARLARVAGAFTDWHAGLTGTPVLLEKKGTLDLSDPPFRLVGRPDRIDRLPDGALAIYDYKTGKPPTKAQQVSFDKQLILLSIMAEEGAFPHLDPAPVEGAAFVALGSKFEVSAGDASPGALTDHRLRLRRLLHRYLLPDQGFTARRAAKNDADRSDYDQLSRRGEWQVTDAEATIRVGDHDE
jgi:ATP-dependent helicase/nuclease subunit B